MSGGGVWYEKARRRRGWLGVSGLLGAGPARRALYLTKQVATQ